MACERNGEIEAKDKGEKQRRNKHQVTAETSPHSPWTACDDLPAQRKEKGSAWSAW
jgi:hypothetical protein